MPKAAPAPAPAPRAQRPSPRGEAPQRTDLAGLAALQQSVGNRAVVRLLGADTLRTVARQGMAGAGSPIDHHSTLQRSLGGYDIGNVRAHVGRHARDATSLLGARGYAMGEQVAFARPPDLRSAAHEVAHVLGQRVGFMPSGAHGRPGDRFERFAEGFADTVARGRSVEPLVDRTLGRGAARSRGRSATAPVQFEIGPDQHGAIVTGHAYFYEAVAFGKDYLLHDIFHEERKPLQVAANDPDYEIVKKPEEAQNWLGKRRKELLETDLKGKDKGKKKVHFGDEPKINIDEIPLSSGLVSMYDDKPLKQDNSDNTLLNRKSLKEKGGGRDTMSKLLSRSTATLYQTKYTELLDALDQYEKAKSEKQRHEALAAIMQHAQHWLATHPKASQMHGDSDQHQEKFTAVEAVRDLARSEFIELAGGKLTADPKEMGENERMMYLLDDILRDPLFAAILDATKHGMFKSLERYLKKGRNYVKMLPVIGIFEGMREARQANRRKERSRAMQEIGEQNGHPLLAHIGRALSDHYHERRDKLRISAGVSALMTPLTVSFPLSGMIGQGASGLTDVTGQLISKTIDKPIEKLSTFISEKSLLSGKDKIHDVKGGRALTEAFAAAVSCFTLDKDVIRSIVLYLGLGPREDNDSPQEASRLALKQMLGCDPEVELLDEETMDEDDQWIKDRLTQRKKGKGVGPDKGNYSSLISDDVEDKGTNWLRALWVSEGFLGDEARRGKSGVKKLVKDEMSSSKDDDSKSLLTGLGSGKKNQSKSFGQSVWNLFGDKSKKELKPHSDEIIKSQTLFSFDEDDLFED